MSDIASVSARATLNTKEAAKYVGFSTSLLEKLRIRGTGPAFVRMSDRVVRYRSTDLDAWMASRVVSSTSQTIAA